jgi:hypothetical protein
MGAEPTHEPGAPGTVRLPVFPVGRCPMRGAKAPGAGSPCPLLGCVGWVRLPVLGSGALGADGLHMEAGGSWLLLGGGVGWVGGCWGWGLAPPSPATPGHGYSGPRSQECLLHRWGAGYLLSLALGSCSAGSRAWLSCVDGGWDGSHSPAGHMRALALVRGPEPPDCHRL